MTQARTIEERIKEFVLKHFPLARKKGLNPSDKWLETGVLDSLGILDLVHFLEEEFSMVIVDDELLPENFQSLGAVAAFIRAKLGSVQTVDDDGQPRASLSQ